METAMIQPILPAYLEIVPPAFEIHWRVAGKREYACIMLAAEKGAGPVYRKVMSGRPEIPQPESDTCPVSAVYADVKPVQVRGLAAPQQGILPHRIVQFVAVLPCGQRE